jgi:hypothetical protein
MLEVFYSNWMGLKYHLGMFSGLESISNCDCFEIFEKKLDGSAWSHFIGPLSNDYQAMAGFLQELLALIGTINA